MVLPSEIDVKVLLISSFNNWLYLIENNITYPSVRYYSRVPWLVPSYSAYTTHVVGKAIFDICPAFDHFQSTATRF